MQPSRQNFATPNFAYNPNTDLIAGVRPYRRESFRLETEQVADKLVVHNYGHGGGGITLGLGCAHEVRDIIKASGQAPAGTPVAILGGGIMGLSGQCYFMKWG